MYTVSLKGQTLRLHTVRFLVLNVDLSVVDGVVLHQ